MAVYSTVAVDLVVDVVGYFAQSNPVLGNYRFVNPVRVVDTRGTDGGPIGFDGPTGNAVTPGPLAAGQTRRFRVGGQTFPGGAIPADAAGLFLNVTIVGQPGGGFVTIFPGNVATVPNASTVNPSTATAFNAWATGVATAGPQQGQIAVYAAVGTHVIVDVVGYISPSAPPTGQLAFVTPHRVVDTRATDGGPIGFDGSGNQIAAGAFGVNATRRYTLAGKTFAGVTYPATLNGVFGSITVVRPGPSGGYATVFPGDAPAAPNASTVNPSTGVDQNFFGVGVPVAPQANPGTFQVFTTDPLDVVVDVLMILY